MARISPSERVIDTASKYLKRERGDAVWSITGLNKNEMLNAFSSWVDRYAEVTLGMELPLLVQTFFVALDLLA